MIFGIPPPSLADNVSDHIFTGTEVEKILTRENGYQVRLNQKRNNSTARQLSGYHETYNNNYLSKDFMYLADAYIDSGAFNSLFGSSVLAMVKFYIEVFILFFNNPEYDTMMSTEGIEKISLEDRQWSNYIKGAMALIRNDSRIAEIAGRQVNRRTNNFFEVHN